MKLLCIDDEKRAGSGCFEQWVEAGEKYTLRKSEGSLTGETRYLLKELKNPKVYVTELMGYFEPGFSSKRFIPLTDDLELVEENVEEEEMVS